MSTTKRKNPSNPRGCKAKIRKTETPSESSQMESYTVAVSSCALLGQQKGDTSGKSPKQLANGPAFPFVKALNMVNQRLGQDKGQFKIVLITPGNSLKSISQTIKEMGLKIEICGITAGKTALDHVIDLKPVLYLSMDADSVNKAIKAGIGAATMFQYDYTELNNDVLRVAFDGDAVLFSDESERVYKNHGLSAFQKNENELVDRPLAGGPLKEFSKALVVLQKKFDNNCPIHTYLVTSRGLPSPGIRALRSLQKHGMDLDEAFLLSGADKGPVLKAVKPHIFFDDQMKHVDSARENGIIGAHVPFGGSLLQKIRPHIFFDDQMFLIERAQELGTIAAHVPYGIAKSTIRGNS